MAKNDNLKDFLTDVADAIREKKGTTDLINPQSFSDEIRAFDIGGGGNTPSRPKWTGHADTDGLRAIGWTDEDIAYYQENGVNWNEEDDQYHLVTDDNKNLYGVLTADNIQTYKDRIVYLPKIDTSTKTDMTRMFHNCRSLVAIPLLDTSKVTDMNNMFANCYSLVAIPLLDTSSAVTMNTMFGCCYSLVSIPKLNTSKVTNTQNVFYYCHSLVTIPQLDLSSVKDGIAVMFYSCNSLVSVPLIDATNIKDLNNVFYNCVSLINVKIKNSNFSYYLNHCSLLSKDSLLYIINNESATSAITITLAPYAYTRLAEDVDIVAALANHPNVSISK